MRSTPLILASTALFAACTRQPAPEAGDVAPTTIPGPAGRLHFDDGGSGGLPVVFVHSFAGSSAQWTNQLAHLRPTRRSVAFDLRGHGQSDAPASGMYAVDSLAGDIAAVVDSLHLERFVLVGHSMGGSAAIAYAGAHPDRVAELVLVGTPGQTPAAQAKMVMTSLDTAYEPTMAGYWKKLLEGAQPSVATQITTERTTLSRAASVAFIRAVFEYDPMPALNAYRGPKQLIDTPHGEAPGSLHNLAPDIPRTLITGTSHWPHMDKPDEFNHILDQALRAAK